MRKKNKAFVLPSTIISILVISLLTLLMVSMVVSTTLSNKALSNTSKSKLVAENLAYVFKNQKTGDRYSGEASLSLDDDTIVTQTYTSLANNHISAVVASRNESVFCFVVYDFENDKTLCYQTGNFDYNIVENLLQYDEINYLKNV